jgi:hypothetical protein
MKSLLEKFKEVVANTPHEVLQQQWDEIEALGLEGPLAKDFIRSFRYTPAVREVKTFSVFTSENSEMLLQYTTTAGNYQFAMAS